MESFYAFTNAIKHCNQYNLTQEKSKSYYGIDQILGSLAEKHDSKTLDSLKNWKANYSLEKLSTEDIKTIDKQLNDFDFDKYLSVEKDKRGNKKAEGKIDKKVVKKAMDLMEVDNNGFDKVIERLHR